MGYDLMEKVVTEGDYTSIESFSRRWMTGALMTDDAYYSHGFEKYDVVSFLKEGTIGVGDFVSVQNRAGVVTDVITGTALNSGNVNDGGIAGIKVLEDLRYLPKDWRSNPTGYGYKSDGRGREVTYVFGDQTKLEGLRNGGGKLETAVPFYGSLMVLKKQTSDKNTWNDIMQAVARRDGL